MSGRIPVLCPVPSRIREFYLDSLPRRIANEAESSGTYTALTEGAVPYAEINGLMGKS